MKRQLYIACVVIGFLTLDFAAYVGTSAATGVSPMLKYGGPSVLPGCGFYFLYDMASQRWSG